MKPVFIKGFDGKLRKCANLSYKQYEDAFYIGNPIRLTKTQEQAVDKVCVLIKKIEVNNA